MFYVYGFDLSDRIWLVSIVSRIYIYPPAAYRKRPIRDFGAPMFMFYVYGFELSDRIWHVCIVMVV